MRHFNVSLERLFSQAMPQSYVYTPNFNITLSNKVQQLTNRCLQGHRAPVLCCSPEKMNLLVITANVEPSTERWYPRLRNIHFMGNTRVMTSFLFQPTNQAWYLGLYLKQLQETGYAPQLQKEKTGLLHIYYLYFSIVLPSARKFGLFPCLLHIGCPSLIHSQSFLPQDKRHSRAWIPGPLMHGS